MNNIIDFTGHLDRKKKEKELAEFTSKFGSTPDLSPEVQQDLFEWIKGLNMGEAQDILDSVYESDLSDELQTTPIYAVAKMMTDNDVSNKISNLGTYEINWTEAFEYMTSIWEAIPNFKETMSENPTKIITSDFPVSDTTFYDFIMDKDIPERGSLLLSICLIKLFKFVSVIQRFIDNETIELVVLMKYIQNACKQIKIDNMIDNYQYPQFISELVKVTLSNIENTSLNNN